MMTMRLFAGAGQISRQPLSAPAMLSVWANFVRAWRRLQYVKPTNREIVDFDRSELGSADDQTADRHRSNRYRAYGKGAHRRDPEGESDHPGRWQGRAFDEVRRHMLAFGGHSKAPYLSVPRVDHALFLARGKADAALPPEACVIENAGRL
jgi:hypothetical protein